MWPNARSEASGHLLNCPEHLQQYPAPSLQQPHFKKVLLTPKCLLFDFHPWIRASASLSLVPVEPREPVPWRDVPQLVLLVAGS